MCPQGSRHEQFQVPWTLLTLQEWVSTAKTENRFSLGVVSRKCLSSATKTQIPLDCDISWTGCLSACKKGVGLGLNHRTINLSILWMPFYSPESEKHVWNSHFTIEWHLFRPLFWISKSRSSQSSPRFGNHYLFIGWITINGPTDTIVLLLMSLQCCKWAIKIKFVGAEKAFPFLWWWFQLSMHTYSSHSYVV